MGITKDNQRRSLGSGSRDPAQAPGSLVLPQETPSPRDPASQPVGEPRDRQGIGVFEGRDCGLQPGGVAAPDPTQRTLYTDGMLENCHRLASVGCPVPPADVIFKLE
ncbi:zinc finger protein 558-like [Ailuropoda melanoleuca]|uniref:zinc finger protein 558-like n=1 Tax=Ailuropoda melanoleuca TaxID=9646 RepID=UPI0014949FC2|nr:zinc finger protein 558-like [Ailuropoda melanoleuca]XP_034503284.1 zinc finger protein 558-like [Ailuropoda melanoleuca]